MRTSYPMPLHAALAGLALAAAAPGVLAQAQAPAACAGLRGGDLVISASPACVGRLQGDSGLKRQVAATIQAEVGTVASPGGQAAGAARDTGGRHGLTHPLARLSALNAQSRYLWSLGNPAPTYYGQTATR